MASWAETDKVAYFRNAKARRMAQGNCVMTVDKWFPIYVESEPTGLALEVVSQPRLGDDFLIALNKTNLSILTIALLDFRLGRQHLDT